MVGHRVLVGVEEFPAFAGHGVGDPHAWGIAGQVVQRDAGRRHLVVVGIRLGVFAHMAAFHYHGPQAKSLQAAADLEAVGPGFQKEKILAGKLLAVQSIRIWRQRFSRLASLRAADLV